MNLDFLDKKDFGKYKPEPIETNLDLLKTVVIKIGEKFEKNFKIEKDSIQAKMYQNLLYYFTDDSRCDWKLDKGLFFSGKKGVGKSMSMKIMRELFLCGHNIPSLQRKKFFHFVGMEKLSVKEGKSLKYLEEFYLKTSNNLFCDEVMRESKGQYKEINNFGTIEQPFSVGIHQMYRNFCDKGMLYHFTTNYWHVDEYPNGDLFAKTYGNEIHDRLIEMCNIIEIKGESFRA